MSDEYLAHILDQLRPLGPVRARRMFGGAGFYLGERMFGLIADDVVYLKVDDANRKEYEAAGMGPFRPFGKTAMPYFEVPAEVVEDRDELRDWAAKSVAVAERAPLPKRKSLSGASGRRARER